jgi:hypothetical protein
MNHKTISRYYPFKEKNGCDFDAYGYGIYHSNSNRLRRVGDGEKGPPTLEY